MTIIEEAAHTSVDMFYKVIVPTLVTGAALLAITTLGGENNFISIMLKKLTPQGTPLFKYIEFKDVCERCERLGLKEKAQCKHLLGDRPHFHNLKSHRQVESIMQENFETYMVEVKNIEVNNNVIPAFDRSCVTDILEVKPLYRDNHHIRHVFVAVDPACGGTRSKYAIVSCIYPDHIRDVVIVGSESAQYREPISQASLLINHIIALRKVPGLESAVIVFIPESNLGFEAIHQAFKLKNSGLSGICVMNEDDNRAGVKINNDIKRLMVKTLEAKINKKKLRFHANFVVTHSGSSVPDIKRELISQLENYSRIIIPSPNLYEPPKEKYSGKMGYGFDDMAIALQLNCLMKRTFFTKPEVYKSYY